MTERPAERPLYDGIIVQGVRRPDKYYGECAHCDQNFGAQVVSVGMPPDHAAAEHTLRRREFFSFVAHHIAEEHRIHEPKVRTVYNNEEH